MTEVNAGIDVKKYIVFSNDFFYMRTHCDTNETKTDNSELPANRALFSRCNYRVCR